LIDSTNIFAIMDNRLKVRLTQGRFEADLTDFF